jgi:hypothetical protein
MCGWPAGVGYPPADGELEHLQAAAEEPEADHDKADEHAAAQLDALAGMAQRRAQPVAPVEPTAPSAPPAEAKSSPADPTAPHRTNAPTPTSDVPPAVEPVTVDTVTEHAVVEDTDVDTTAQPTKAGDADGDEANEVDPLTAPIEALAAPQSSGDTDVDLPVAAATADAVAATVVETTSTPDMTEDAAQTPEPYLNDEVTLPDAPVALPEPGRAASLARPTQLLIVAAAVLNVVLAGMQAAFGTPIDASMTTVVLAVSLVTLAVWTGAAVAFLHWVSRAYAHVAAYSLYRQRTGSTLSLVGWLIPIVGFVVGYRVLQDLWTGSDPATRDEPDAKPTKARMIDVWLLGLVTASLFAYAMPFALGDSALWSGVAAVGVAAAGLALASTISRVSNWQTNTVIFDSATDTVPVLVDEGTVSTRVDDLETDGTASTDEPSSEPASTTAP